jgi:hypothetical protein
VLEHVGVFPAAVSMAVVAEGVSGAVLQGQRGVEAGNRAEQVVALFVLNRRGHRPAVDLWQVAGNGDQDEPHGVLDVRVLVDEKRLYTGQSLVDGWRKATEGCILFFRKYPQLIENT